MVKERRGDVNKPCPIKRTMIKHELTCYFHHKVKDYTDFLMNKDHLKFGFLLELHTYVTFQEIIKY